MHGKQSISSLIIILSLGIFFLWLSVVGLNRTGNSLAYPPPPTNAAYPGPPASTSTPSPTSDNLLAQSNTQTPWPTPTAYAVTPALTPRKGVAPSMGGAAAVLERHYFASWGYYWTYTLPTDYPANTNYEHVPMLAGNVQEWQTTPTPSVGALATIDARTPHNYWLVFNECEHQDQCNTLPSQAASAFSGLLIHLLQADSDAKLIVGGVNAHECGVEWLKNFVDLLDPDDRQHIAGWHFHLYPDVIPRDWLEKGLAGCDSPWIYYDPRVATVADAWDAWQTDVWNIHNFVQEYGDLVEDELWITEMGCLNPGNHQIPQPVCQADGYMYEYVTRITGWLNSNSGRWIDRYAWYTDWNAVSYWNYTKLYAITFTPTAVVVTPGTPTPTPTPTRTPGPTPTMVISALGQYYIQVTPAAAGEWDDLMPHKLFLPLAFR